MSNPSDRDTELDGLTENLRKELSGVGRHVEKPDELDVPKNGMCWLDKHRMCEASCIAFGDPDEPEPIQRCGILKGGLEALVLLRRPLREVEVTGDGFRNLGAPPIIPPPDPMGRKKP